VPYPLTSSTHLRLLPLVLSALTALASSMLFRHLTQALTVGPLHQLCLPGISSPRYLQAVFPHLLQVFVHMFPSLANPIKFLLADEHSTLTLPNPLFSPFYHIIYSFEFHEGRDLCLCYIPSASSYTCPLGRYCCLLSE
jgi:hypothetical protein